MAANSNFAIKVTLDEANDIRDALVLLREERMIAARANGGGSFAKAAPDMLEQIGRVEKLLRLDFGVQELKS